MVARLLEKAVAGERLTPGEGVELLESHDLAALGQAANRVTELLVEEGDIVQKGDVLLRLENDRQKTAYARASAP